MDDNNFESTIYNDFVKGNVFIEKFACGHYKIVIKKTCHLNCNVELLINKNGEIFINGKFQNNSCVEILLTPGVEDDEFIHGYIWRGSAPILENAIKAFHYSDDNDDYEFIIYSFENVFGKRVKN